MARETLVVDIQSNGAVKAKRGIDNIAESGRRAGEATEWLKKKMQQVGAVLVLRQLARTADSYRNIANRIATVTKSHDEAAAVMERVFKIANDTRQSFEATGIVYARVANAATDLGKSHEQVLKLVRGLNQAMAIGGTTSREANAALIQFSQGLASGTLRGDELRSVLEQSVVVSEVLSRGLGVTRGELKKMGEQGKISSQLIFESFAKMEDELEERFSELVPTLSQSFEVFKNHLIKFVGEADQASQVTRTLGKALVFLAKHLSEVAGVLAVVAGRAGYGLLMKKTAELRGSIYALASSGLGALSTALSTVVSVGFAAFGTALAGSARGAFVLTRALRVVSVQGVLGLNKALRVLSLQGVLGLAKSIRILWALRMIGLHNAMFAASQSAATLNRSLKLLAAQGVLQLRKGFALLTASALRLYRELWLLSSQGVVGLGKAFKALAVGATAKLGRAFDLLALGPVALLRKSMLLLATGPMVAFGAASKKLAVALLLNPFKFFMGAITKLIRLLPIAIGLLVAFGNKISIATPSGGKGTTSTFIDDVIVDSYLAAAEKGTTAGEEFTHTLAKAIKVGSKEVKKELKGASNAWDKATALGKKSMLRDHKQAWEDIKEITNKKGKEAGAAAGVAYADSFKKSPSMKLSSFFSALWEKIQEGAASMSDKITQIFGHFGIGIKISFKSVAVFIARMWDGLVKITQVIAYGMYIIFDVAFHNIKEVAKRTWKWLKDAAQSAQYNLAGTGPAPESEGDSREKILSYTKEQLKLDRERLHTAKFMVKESLQGISAVEKALARGKGLKQAQEGILKNLNDDLKEAQSTIRDLTDTVDSLNNASTGAITDKLAVIAEITQDLKDNPLDTGSGFRNAFSELKDMFVDTMTAAGGAESALEDVFKRAEEIDGKKIKNAADLGTKGIDRTKIAAEEAAAALAKLWKAWNKLYDSMHPVTVANREFTADQKLLDWQFGLGLITITQYNDMLAKLKGRYEERREPAQHVLRQMREENTLLGMSTEARERAVKVRAIELDLIAKSDVGGYNRERDLTPIVAELDIKEDITYTNAVIEAQQQRAATVLKSIKGPQEEYDKNLMALNQHQRDNAISTNEYTVALMQLKLALLDTQLSAAAGFERGMIRIQQQIMDVASMSEQVMGSAFTGIEELATSTITGFTDGWSAGIENMQDAFKSFVDQILADLIRLMIRWMLFNAISGMGGGSKVSGIAPPPISQLPVPSVTLPGYQHGAQWRVGGTGGPDSQMVQFMASPNETVTVATPQQQQAVQPQAVNLKVTNVVDPSETIETMNSPAGERIFMNMIQRNSAAIRRAVQ